MKKIIALIFILCIAFPTILGNNIQSMKTIYVDDDNTEGPWDGSIEHPYRFITDALQEASGEDTIFVNFGTYAENLMIAQSIILIGEDQTQPIINGGTTGNVILVTASDVSIQGFFITQDDSNQDAGIRVNADNCDISRNCIDDCNEGIYLDTAFNCNLEKNTINSCLIGIYLYDSDSNTIQMNEVSNCSTGIYIEESSKNLVTVNSIQENIRGIFSSYATDNILTQNSFLNNEESAKFTKYLFPGFLKPNKWDNNYWDDWIGFGVKFIPGLMYIPINEDPIGYFFPWIEIDWDPLSVSQ